MNIFYVIGIPVIISTGSPKEFRCHMLSDKILTGKVEKSRILKESKYFFDSTKNFKNSSRILLSSTPLPYAFLTKP